MLPLLIQVSLNKDIEELFKEESRFVENTKAYLDEKQMEITSTYLSGKEFYVLKMYVDNKQTNDEDK